VKNVLQGDGVIEIELSGEAKAIPERAGQQTGASCGTDQREAWDVERYRGCPWTLPDNDIYPKVLHGQVEHFLGRSRHSMDFVEKEDLAFDQPGQDGGEIAGVLDGRTARDP
jgi:hypothetical protein